MSTATLIGSGSVGTFMPSSFAALAAAVAAIQLPIVDLEAQISGAIAASASISIQPPSLDLSAALDAALQLPGISIDINVMANLAASLNLTLGQFQLVLALLLAVQLAFGTAGVYAFALEGQITKMGPDLTTLLGGGIPGLGDPNAQGFGVMLLAQDGGAVTALKTLFSALGA